MDARWKLLLIELVLLTLVIADISLLWQSAFLCTVIAAGIVVFAMLFFHSREDILFYCTGAVLGSVVEIISIKFGAWQYGNPTFFGIPSWLPFFWGCAFLFLRRLRDAVFRLEHLQVHYSH